MENGTILAKAYVETDAIEGELCIAGNALDRLVELVVSESLDVRDERDMDAIVTFADGVAQRMASARAMAAGVRDAIRAARREGEPRAE